jgi:peptide/nickel transport system permease protein
VAAETAARLRKRLWRRPPAVIGAVVVLLFVVLALAAPWIATSDPQRSDYGKIRKAPTAANPFGTDDLGRDIFSRVVWGTRISMQAGVFSILLAIAIGVPAGLTSGYRRGVTDQLIMRLTRGSRSRS